MFSANSPTSVANRAIALTISADQPSSYNVFTAAGSPSDAVDVTVTVNAGIRVSQMRALSFAPGSRIFLVNNGTIFGAGGAGGAGQTIFGAGSYSALFPGAAGTDALQSNCRLIITNASGLIFGGGGGGGGGHCGSQFADGSGNSGGGAGGGGGRGYPGGAGGAGGTAGGGGGTGHDGTAGTDTAIGVGLGGGTQGGTQGASGSNGGTIGAAGNSDETGNAANPFATSGGSNAAGGAPGRAIFSNGAGVTWISGSSNVAGTVS